MVLHNPNNWHWVNKDASSWARSYLEKELIGTSSEADGSQAKITKILSQEGDVDVSQRKGKVITLFDIRLQLEYSGSTPECDELSGTITVPEVAHDTEEDEFVFETDIYSETPEKEPVKKIVREGLQPQLRKKLATLGPELIAAHAKDLQHAQGADPSQGFAKSKQYDAAQDEKQKNNSSSSSASKSGTSGSTKGPKINVTTVNASDEFRTSAQELYNTFTDPQRIAAFTRAPPRQWEGAKEGASFAIFDGNVTGTFEELKEPTRIVQKWRLAQWPEGHFSRLEMNFDQNDVDAVTVMRVKWSGVPVGQEEVVQKNWGEYYVRSMKKTFGFGTIL